MKAELVEGFTSWYETYFEIVSFIIEVENYYNESINGCENELVYLKRQEQGQGGIYELAKDWTDEFEKQYKNIVWGEDLDWTDTIENWLITKNNPK